MFKIIFSFFKIVNISCGRFHSACVDLNGVLYTWGRGATGQLGHGDSLDQAIPKKVEGSLKELKIKQVRGFPRK